MGILEKSSIFQKFNHRGRLQRNQRNYLMKNKFKAHMRCFSLKYEGIAQLENLTSVDKNHDRRDLSLRYIELIITCKIN